MEHIIQDKVDLFLEQYKLTNGFYIYCRYSTVIQLKLLYSIRLLTTHGQPITLA